MDRTALSAALDGIRVLDLTRALAGPYCTMLLGDLGADIVKVEPPGGDESRTWGPPFLDGESSYYLSINRNKRSIVVNLKDRRGQEIAQSLAQRADILVENFRPGVASKLGLDYPRLRTANPRLIYCAISGFGQTGPYRERPGYDIVAFAMSGLMDVTGEQGRPPVKMGVAVADIGAGMFAAYAILAALWARERRGTGQFIDVSLLDSQLAWLSYQAGYYFASGNNPERTGSAHSLIAPYQAFRARDHYFIVAVGNDDMWHQLCTVLGAHRLAADRRFRSNPHRVRNRRILEQRLQRIFQRRPVREWLKLLGKAGIPAAPIHSVRDAVEDPHVQARGLVVDAPHATLQHVRMVGPPVKLSDTPPVVRRGPPRLGEHTEEILAELGYNSASIQSLRAAGIVR